MAERILHLELVLFYSFSREVEANDRDKLLIIAQSSDRQAVLAQVLIHVTA